ncbi:Uncharacterized protein dnm_061380 [Desulfonema magnum]|uniref:Uncharacterized protein n=1 Tax=Desulfonema magnum TaxID=45655 RepID=A0A975BRG6_9BACT|nr:Uncharacterized protein dnm_061380 [Desulfonema magnum]
MKKIPSGKKISSEPEERGVVFCHRHFLFFTFLLILFLNHWFKKTFLTVRDFKC